MHRLLNSLGAGDRDDCGMVVVRNLRATNTYLRGTLHKVVIRLHEEGPFNREGKIWKNAGGDTIFQQSVEALYERLLVTIVVESRHRKRHTVMLTDIGRAVARDLIRTRDERQSFEKPPVSEESAVFIAQVTA